MVMLETADKTRNSTAKSELLLLFRLSVCLAECVTQHSYQPVTERERERESKTDK